jgi:hypothetical protein
VVLLVGKGESREKKQKAESPEGSWQRLGGEKWKKQRMDVGCLIA